MAKYKQECIFGIRAVIEAIQQEKEIDKVMLKQGVRGELFQQLFSLIRERNIPFQYVPEDVFKPFADRNHQGVLAEISPVPYQDLTEVLDGVEAAGRVPFVLILDRVTDVRNFGAIVRSAECAGVEQTNGSYKNIFAHANEEECPQKRGDKEWRTGALLLSQ
jgi:23S rRNA (guanosine2251-2'-O)-methyltransferase